ncbi:MAG: hypothetical protein ACFFDK_06060 [Promethearchaeota archaeon]
MENENRLISLKNHQRTHLFAIMDHYLDSMLKKDIRALKTTGNVKFTENGKILEMGQGVWQTVSSISYRQYFVDPLMGQVAVFCVIDEGGVPAILMVRLKIIGHEIADVETIVTRNGEASVFYPKALKIPKPIFDEILESSERSSREEMILIANSYFDGIEQNDGTNIPFHPDCNRRENGFQTTNNPRSEFTKYDCYSQISKFTYITKVRDRRFMILDEERGLVWGIFLLDCPGDVGSESLGSLKNPRTIVVAECFKIISGKIREIEVFMVNVPYGSASGW